MSRVLKSLSVTYRYTNPADLDYKIVRRLNGVDPKATDGQILAIGQAFAKLIDGDVLTDVSVTTESTVEA